MEDLARLPARMDAVEAQILQLRGEIRVEFSAIHERFGTIDQQLAETRAMIKDSEEEPRRHMRVLHEEVLSRISLLQEGRVRRRR